MRDVVITTAADSGYFEMFRGMLQSLRNFDTGRKLDVCAFDLGLEAEERAWLERAGVTFAQPEWHLGLRDGMMPHWHLAEIVRPFVRDYFPRLSPLYVAGSGPLAAAGVGARSIHRWFRGMRCSDRP